MHVFHSYFRPSSCAHGFYNNYMQLCVHGLFTYIGYLSVVPLKAATDQQEVYERAVIQQNNQELERELKSARDQECMFEMQLDSASNYMESKISRFEDNLAQYRDRIGVLEEKNRALKQKLQEQSEKMKSLEAKLKNLTESEIEEDTDHQLLITSTPRSLSLPPSQDSAFCKEFTMSLHAY